MGVIYHNRDGQIYDSINHPEEYNRLVDYYAGLTTGHPHAATKLVVKLICSWWLCDHQRVEVHNSKGLTEAEAVAKAMRHMPQCSCGRRWKRWEIE